jgi:hypothetical protein
VLARPELFDGNPEETVRKSVFASLKTHFSGPVAYIAGTAKLSLHHVAADGGLSSEPAVLDDWSKLPAALSP